ncbi:MAG: hypothetical protein AAFP85_19990, partial [Pseudomonadota bacterium]
MALGFLLRKAEGLTDARRLRGTLGLEFKSLVAHQSPPICQQLLHAATGESGILTAVFAGLRRNG